MEAFHAWARYDYADSAHMGREASPLCNDNPQGETWMKKTVAKSRKHHDLVSRIDSQFRASISQVSRI
jgi:hypothetical protein